MVVMSPSMESLEICREELKDDFSFCIQEPRGGFVNGEIISRRFDKGTGVLKVCEHLGIPLEEALQMKKIFRQDIYEMASVLSI